MTLRSDVLECTVLSGKGADVYSLVDRASGIDVLFKTPWGQTDPLTTPPLGDTQADFLARYGGGWQLLLPNAGPARVVHGVRRGFHGEAALRAWRVDDVSDSHVELSTLLHTAPLHLHRSIRVTGGRLDVEDAVTNLSDVPIELAWSQHPAFSAQFLGRGARLHTTAGRFVSDADAPGTVLPANREWALNEVRAEDGTPVDLTRLPGPDERREIFGTLLDFTEGAYTIDSPQAGFGIEVRWPLEVFPHAWYWQEWASTADYPWFRRARAFAVEPSTITTTGRAAPGGAARALAAEQTWTATTSINRVALR